MNKMLSLSLFLMLTLFVSRGWPSFSQETTGLGFPWSGGEGRASFCGQATFTILLMHKGWLTRKGMTRLICSPTCLTKRALRARGMRILGRSVRKQKFSGTPVCHSYGNQVNQTKIWPPTTSKRTWWKNRVLSFKFIAVNLSSSIKLILNISSLGFHSFELDISVLWRSSSYKLPCLSNIGDSIILFQMSCGGVPSTCHQKQDPKEDQLEDLCLSAGLVTPWGLSEWTGGRDWGQKYVCCCPCDVTLDKAAIEGWKDRLQSCK